jgi:anaerobic selenocysteine-containing dehydrogenase
MAPTPTTTEIATFCPLCVSRCGARATVTDGTFTLEPDPSHPTGQALCVKGRAAPEITAHPDRLRYPVRRTAPKGGDPGWQRISWDEALDTVADRLQELAREHGPESVVFSSVSPSTSAIVDAVDWIQRLQRAFGSPNLAVAMELCGWGRYLASLYTYGASVPGQYLPDLDRAGGILFWGYNPSVSRLSHATATTAAVRRGARLIVVDPRRTGLAAKADPWLRVRPGTDAALALAIMDVMLARGWYDEPFVRRWTNAPLLVRADTGRLLRAEEVVSGDGPIGHVAWDELARQPVVVDPAARGTDVEDHDRLALAGTFEVPTVDGPVVCRPAFDLLVAQCRATPPTLAEGITGVPAAEIERTAELLWRSRPLAFYTWSGLEQHSGTTQIIRAINVLYALTGCLDAPGGNVLFTPVPTNAIAGMELLDPAQRAKTIGVADRPLGPARFEFVTGEDLYTAALEGRPYRARGLVSFGANLVMAHGDSARGRDALQALDFHVHLDLFMNPTAEQADLVLPVTGAFEAEGLNVGFEISQEAQSLVQLRTPLVPPVGEARSDLQVIFDLATRLGLGERFFGGDLEAGWRYQLEPSGISLEQLRDTPSGVRLPLRTRHRKYAAVGDDGVPAGFATPTGRIELYAEAFLDVGQPPLPTFTEPATSPRSRPDLAEEFPLVLTCAKSLHFCETQHRQVASLRRRAPDPPVELHPDTAAARGIAKGDWVEIRTPRGRIRARAALNRTLAPDVVCGQHGWAQPCEQLGSPGHPPFGPDSANLNLVLAQTPSDPVSGSSPLRAQLCEVTRLAE